MGPSPSPPPISPCIHINILPPLPLTYPLPFSFIGKREGGWWDLNSQFVTHLSISMLNYSILTKLTGGRNKWACNRLTNILNQPLITLIVYHGSGRDCEIC